MNFSVRRATADDAEACLNLLKQLCAEPNHNLRRDADEITWTVEEEATTITEMNAADNGIFLVAEDHAGQIIGFATCEGGKLRAERHTAELGISVDAGWRGQGVGRALIDFMLDWARRESPLKRITLWVLTRNSGAVRLYERYGWQIEGHMRHDMLRGGEYLDTYYMALFLDGESPSNGG